MSLVVQVTGPGGGGSAPPPGQKGVVISTVGSRLPPPAHVHQPPFSFQAELSSEFKDSLKDPPQHVVQQHPPPAPAQGALYPRPLPLSPGRPPRLRENHRVLGNPQLPTQPLPSHHLPLLSPSPAHNILATSVNSPSLIPQNIPSGFMPRLPIHVPVRTRHMSPVQVSQVSHDTNILPPHVLRKLTRPGPVMSLPDDDIEIGDGGPMSRRASLMSPKLNKKSLFNNLALQDHNYCAAPPPSPPRSVSPPPPVSPYKSHALPNSMGVVQGMAPKDHQESPDQVVGGYNLTPSSPGVAPSVGGYPSPHYTGTLLSPKNKLKQSLEDAGVGPMTPLGDSDKDRSLDNDGGEETETAPEAEEENQDDAVTRCICEFLHDDGYMICCDKCYVWQHVVCMGLDKNNIPDEYLCEKCSPRPVDRKRAKALQKARAKEIYTRMRPEQHMSSDDEKSKPSGDKTKKSFSSIANSRKLLGKKTLEKDGKKIGKKPHKRRSFKEGSRMQDSSSPGSGGTSPTKKSGSGSVSPRKHLHRKSLSGSDAETEPETETPGESISLRSWIDNYEEAITNHYSPELRARLMGAKLQSNTVKPKDVSGIRCNVSLRGNGLKVLTANSYIPSDTPVIECRGKYMLNNPGLNKASKNNPYVLLHRLSPELEVLVDGTTYGNDSRFCRRASPSTGESNAVIKHHVEKGSLHLYIVASKSIEKNSEILLPPLERKNGFVEEAEMSIADELREIKKASSGKMVNGTTEGGRRKVMSKKRVAKRDNAKKKNDDSSSDEEEDVRKEREVRIAREKERLARQREEREKAREEKTSPRKTRSAAVSSIVNDVKEEVVKEVIKEDIKKEIKKEEEVLVEEKPLSIVIPKEKEDPGSVPNSPSVGKSPTKPSLGLPDQSGLIVGVNTINYDVSFRNKTKTREERKMEMIMKAFEAMERTEKARKRNESDTQTPKPEKKRRRSNSTKTGNNAAAGDSNLDQSSADEGYGGVAKRKGRGKRLGPGAVSSGRRRSRAKSGDSSAVSETETNDEVSQDNFKYPGHRASEDHDDDVSRQYIRGSRSPPGIANHLLRSAKPDRNKETVKKQQIESPTVEPVEVRQQNNEIKTSIGCSAKKRWLMAAMSVDMSETERLEEGSGNSPAPTSPELPDYTPLKKRRLATYTNDASDDVIANITDDKNVSDKIKSLPNGLKKRLISNLVLEAVLDTAMEGYKTSGFNDDSNNEDTSSPFINDEDDQETVDKDDPEPGDKIRTFKDKRKEAIYKAELEMGRLSNNSSESEEVNNESVHCKQVFVNMKKCPVPEPEQSTSSPVSSLTPSQDDTPVPETGVTTPDTNFAPVTKIPDSKEVKEVEKIVQEAEKEEDVPAEEQEFCSTPLQTTCSTPLETACSTPLQDEPMSADDTAANVPPVPSQHCQFKSFFSTDLSVEDIDRQLEVQRSALVSVSAPGASPISDIGDVGDLGDSRPSSAGDKEEPSQGSSVQQPSVKKRVSLADYKKRKQRASESGGTGTPTTAPSTPNLATGLTSSMPSLPSLPSLPGLDMPSQTFARSKAEKLQDKEQSRTGSPDTENNDRLPSESLESRVPPVTFPEPPREDLTERLRKEFGLNIDESDEADTDEGDKEPRDLQGDRDARDRKDVPKHHKSERREGSSSGGSSHKPNDYNRSNKYSKDPIRSRDGGYGGGSGDKYSKYSDSKRIEYRDYREKSRDSRHHDKARHGSRRPSHPSSPSGSERSRGHVTNGGSGSRRHHASPARGSSSQEDGRYSSHGSGYYKSEPSKRNNISRNFYTQ